MFFRKLGAHRFSNRVEAGQRLAAQLAHLRGQNVVVLGLPRGGVPVALEVADALGAPLDVILVRKLGLPNQPELGMGAIGEGGIRVINRDLVNQAGVGERQIEVVEESERTELRRRALRYRGDRNRADMTGRTVVIVDDGIATGSTARAACEVARAGGASRVVLATPVAPRDWALRLAGCADEYVCVETPEPFRAIGEWYADFSQTTDEEVIACLCRRQGVAPSELGAGPDSASAPTSTSASTSTSTGTSTSVPVGAAVDREVTITLSGTDRLSGHLTLPPGAPAVVIFVHGSGSSRYSPRNQFVARMLSDVGLGTLLFDLLTVEEEAERVNVFNVELLADRLVQVTGWLWALPGISAKRIGYFGASTGAAAALKAAAGSGHDVAAVVSRGGRPDLAGPWLGAVTAPTLLIVGSRDRVVLDLNRQAQRLLQCENQLVTVEGATHLFEEPGTLQTASLLARNWFLDHLTPAPGGP